MPDDLRYNIGVHVRLRPNFYIINFFPQNNWTGTIVQVKQSLMGQPTEYLVHLDERFQEQDRDVDVFEDDIEQC